MNSAAHTLAIAQPSNRAPRALVVAVVAVVGFWAASARADFSESVHFAFSQNNIQFQGPINTAWLMLDVDGGRNKVQNARQMQCDNGSPKTCSLDVPLAEGDYIYTFVVNADAFVNMSDPALNPDDIPDSNFFRDPSPRNPGFCGQFSTDNCLFVRNPARPTFDATTFQPGQGALVTTSSQDIAVDVHRGSSNSALDAATVHVFIEDAEPAGVRFTSSGDAVAPRAVAVPGATFTANASGGTVHATITNLPEGFHRVLVDISDATGLAADEFVGSLLINRDNQAPVAHAGTAQFTGVNQEVVLDGSLSEDPDQIGFSEFQWRVISGPGTGTFRCVDEELIPRDGFGRPFFDGSGNTQGDACPRSDFGAMPRFAANVAGVYTVGLKVKDIGAGGGLLSAESTTRVFVSGAMNTTVHPRLEVVVDGNTVTVDGSLTVGGGSNVNFVADDDNPAALSLAVNGRVATFTKPSTPGAYLVHLQIDDSYPATAMIRVDASGAVDGFDLALPPKDWRTEKVVYLAFVREFFDENGDGEGDLLGMIDKMDYLARLGVTTIWLMPLSEGPTTHGYATTGAFSIDADYGTSADLELLNQTAKAFGLETMMDFVANHTSDQHPFFQAASANPQSPLRDFYSFNSDGTSRHAFGFFALPDNNQNNPVVRQTLMQEVDWFMDRGFENVRCDIAGFSPPSFWREVRRHVKARAPNAVMLAELLPPMPEYFDHAFDFAYDPDAFSAMRDAFAVGGGLDGINDKLQNETRLVAQAQTERARNSTRQEDVLFMRYLDDQDEDRFLERAGKDFRKLRAAIGVQMTTPGVPLITYGDEVGIEELRGRFPFFDYNDDSDSFGDSARDSLMKFYRKLIRVRRGNRALRSQDLATGLADGNTYLRISSNNDDGGGNVYSFMRFDSGQRFIVMVNRADSTAIGTSARVFPPASLFTDFPDQNLILVDHLDPTFHQQVSRAQLTASGGVTFNVPAFGTRVLQVTENGIPDADDDKVLDSYDNCFGIANLDQRDLDGDDVGDRCDQCPTSPRGAPVGRDGCAPAAGAPRARYALDGALDDAGYQVASGTGIHLYASFNGQVLYVATEAAARGEDVFIVVTDDAGRSFAAPFAKSGTVPSSLFLADEGENDFTKWFGATGEAISATEPLPGRGVLEGTLNLVEMFGEVPANIHIAALRYGGADAGHLLAQAPAGNGDDVVDASEMYALSTSLPPLVDVGEGEGEGGGSEGEGEGEGGSVIGLPGDVDGDGVPNLIDNCPELYNPAQADSDSDGLGDGCDACPLTAPGVAVDARGCGEHDTLDPGAVTRANPRVVDPNSRRALERECGCTTSGNTDAGPATVLALALGLAWRLRRRTWTARTSV